MNKPLWNESSFSVYYEKALIFRLARRSSVKIMLERNGTLQRTDNVHLPAFGSSNPSGKLDRVRDSSTKHNNVDVGRQQDENFLPDDSALAVVDIMHLIEDDPFQIANDI